MGLIEWLAPGEPKLTSREPWKLAPRPVGNKQTSQEPTFSGHLIQLKLHMQLEERSLTFPKPPLFDFDTTIGSQV